MFTVFFHIPKAGYEPQLTHYSVHIINIYQGLTPLMDLCSTGCADCVKYLAEQKADLTVQDFQGRGCLQLADRAQGENRPLYNWLREHVQGIQMTSGKGRPKDERQSGSFSSYFRKFTGDH